MKIVLISTDETHVAMGVKTLSSNLLQHGFEVTVVIMSSWDNSFKRFYWKDLEEICSDAGLIGISCMTHGLRKAIEVRNNLNRNIKTPIIIGGIHATLDPESLFDKFDLICHGEGEDLIVELASRINNNKSFNDLCGLWSKSNGKFFKNQPQPLMKDLNNYPFPDYDLSHQFILESNRLVPLEQTHIICDYFEILGSRGCPHTCTFCSNYKIKQDFPWRKNVRQYSVDYFINHLKEICRIYPVVKSFWLEDDTFFAKNYDEIQLFASRYKEEINKPFCILISPWTYNEAKVKLLIEAGMDKLIMGIQSGSERTNRDIYGRIIYNKRILEIVLSLKNFKQMLPYYDFIGMNPFETRDDLISTIQLVKKFPPPFFIFSNNLAFYPGTELRKRAVKAGLDVSKRNRHTDAKHGYSILIHENIEHKFFHFLFLMMGGKANKFKIGFIPRFLISDRLMRLYCFFDKKFSYLMNKAVSALSIILICFDWKEILKKMLKRKQIDKLKKLYHKFFK